MDTVISLFYLIQKSIFAVGPFIILLGVLIFIHELGHFLVARYFGVKVEVFSLGFGPKILKYKKGDTVYCLSLLPLGGYVKMFGDNPLAEVPDSEKSKGFLYKKVPEKWLIAFGGPFMNLLFTLLAFFILALYGLSAFIPQLGDIQPNTPAYTAGFRSGDQILSINDKKISYMQEISESIKNKTGEQLSFKVKSSSNEIKHLSATVQSGKNFNPLEWKKNIGSIEGLNFMSTGLRVGVIYNSSAYKAGLRTFDEITQLNGKKLRYWRDLEALIKNTKAQSLHLKLKRESEIKAFTIQKSSFSLSGLGLEPAFLYVERIGPDTPAQQAGLLKGDRLLAINGEKLYDWKQVLDVIESSSGKSLSIKYARKGKEKTVSLKPKSLFVDGNIKERFMVGIVSGGLNQLPEPTIKKLSVFQAVIYSGQETVNWLGYITTGLIRLIQGEVSLRTMGGPIMIGRVAHSSFHQGFSSFLLMMAIISLNLFFLNLLPIPLLDGGHILFFTLEGLLGRPLSVKKLIVAQQVGLMVLLSFMGFAFFNDIYNWLKAW